MGNSVSNLPLASFPARAPDLRAGHRGSFWTDLSVRWSDLVTDRVAAALAQAESTIGSSDTTLPIVATRKQPWRMICSLELDFDGMSERQHGTGWLAGPSSVITAGHCLFDQTYGWARAVTVIPGRSGSGPGAAPFGSSLSRSFSVAQQWKTGASKGHDIGCIHLDAEPGQSLGWFRYDTVPGAVTGVAVNCAGYSDYLGLFSKQSRSSGLTVGLSAGRLFYTTDTQKGASGAPIMLDWAEGEIPQVIAVHAYNEDERVPEIASESNSGPWLSVELIALIEEWNTQRPNT